MDITKTTNSALSRYVALDASYISRLRSGKRLLPRNDGNIRSMAAYFARNCKDDFRQNAMSGVIGVNPLPKEHAELTSVITDWLLKEKNSPADSVEQFLGGLSAAGGVDSGDKSAVSPANEGMFKPKGKAVPGQKPEIGPADFPKEELTVYYGIEGKRQAVIHFLSEVVSQEKPQMLLLFSDEETSWMTEDPVFSRQWAGLMVQTLSRGHRIKIIHTISRDLDEMLNAIAQWMPLYMAGTIEPYFYPKKRDGIFKRTLFVLPGKAAVVSGSVGDQTAHAANLLFHDPSAVESYEAEFLKYLNLCRPLMRIFGLNNREDCLATLKEFEKEHCNALIKTESLSLVTMQEGDLSEIFRRNNLAESDLLDFQRTRVQSFLKLLETHIFTEIITLPDPQAVIQGQIKIALSDMLDSGAIYYSPEEYLLHLKSIYEYLSTHKNYHLHIISEPAAGNCSVYVKEDLGVVVAKNSLPPAVLAMSEGNMTAAFWDFLKGMIGAKAFTRPNKKDTILKLNDYISRLEALNIQRTV